MPPWREYEEGICEMLRAKVEPDSRVEFDVKLAGRLSGIERQVDVYVEGRFAGDVLPAPATLSVDCKCWSSPVDVSDVERFIGLVEDVGTDFGLMITTVGFSSAARNRAARARGVQIDVIRFDELERWRPDVQMCQVCQVDPESDNMPGMFYVVRYEQDGQQAHERVFVGQCDRCHAVHVLCSCGTLNGVFESDGDMDLECQGCGRLYRVEQLEFDRDRIPINDSPHERVKLC